jgi:hypothetical protein
MGSEWLMRKKGGADEGLASERKQRGSWRCSDLAKFR